MTRVAHGVFQAAGKAEEEEKKKKKKESFLVFQHRLLLFCLGMCRCDSAAAQYRDSFVF